MDNTKNLKDLSNQITENTNIAVNKYANELYTELVEELPIGSLSEIVFKEYFLEFFQKGNSSNTDAPLALKWLEVAGGPYNGINIVDNFGNLLYTTPGLYARPTPSKAIENADLDNIATNFNLKSNVMHNAGINYLENQIGGLNREINVSTQEHQLKWQAIFNRYDTKKKTNDVKVKPSITDNISSFLDYD